MKKHLLQSLRLTCWLAVFFCGAYTAVLWGIARFAPDQGRGEKASAGDKTFFANVGQRFTDDGYFWSRPSAVDYNAAGSAGSNKGPSNPDYLAVVEARIDTFLAHNPGVERSRIPSDLVTASGSGLDPHISVQGALVQVPRISARRDIAEENLQALVRLHTERPLLGLFGTERINVLRLNLELDELKK